MRNIYVVRRAKLRVLSNFYESDAALASWLEVTPSYVCQLIGENFTKNISEKTARKFEQKLSLPAGVLDR